MENLSADLCDESASLSITPSCKAPREFFIGFCNAFFEEARKRTVYVFVRCREDRIMLNQSVVRGLPVCIRVRLVVKQNAAMNSGVMSR